jgi:hypothetical protein
MKTLALFLIAALLILTVGCEESAVRRVTANPVDAAAPAKAPVVKTLRINEQVALQTPEGFAGSADVIAQITYVVTEVTPNALSKEIPVKPVFTLNLSAKGEVAPGTLVKGNGLAKPITWAFKGTITNIVEEGGDFTAAFQLEGTKYRIAHLHMGFSLAHGELLEDMLYVDFHSDPVE